MNHDLRNRSFRKKNLALMDFRGADIRGCDFTGAILSGADFSQVKAGLSFRQRSYLTVLTLSVAIVAIDALSRLIFNTIGQSPLDPNSTYIPILYAAFSLTGICCGIAAIDRKSRFGQISLIITAILSGAIVAFAAGFFYPGLLHHLLLTSQQNPSALKSVVRVLKFLDDRHLTIAPRLAITGAIVMLGATWFRRTTSFKVAISVAGSVVSYAATFFWSTIASAYFGNHNLLFGILFSIVALIYFGCLIASIWRIRSELKFAIGTSFRKAELTHARFDDADLRGTDFSQAIGYVPLEIK